eukprot:4296518-Prymnesium_polylepis.1
MRAEAAAQRLQHLNMTKWAEHELPGMSAAAGLLVICDDDNDLERVTSLSSNVDHAALATQLMREECKIVAMAVPMQRAQLARLPAFVLEVTLVLTQLLAVQAAAPQVWLLATGAHEARRPQHAGNWGLARAARAELSLPLRCVDPQPGEGAVLDLKGTQARNTQ